MLRSSQGRTQRAGNTTCQLLVFSVGGRKLAVKTEEVVGISPWPGSFPVPSRTPFISAVVRQDQAVVPVFDLGDLLHAMPQGEELLCLTAKHPLGAMALCIDEDMPVLHSLDRAAIEPYQGGEFDAVGSFTSGFDQIPIMSFARLGMA